MTMASWIVALAVAVALLFAGMPTEAVLRAPERSLRKQLAGPASEFASMAVPTPESAAVRADSAFVPVFLAKVAGEAVFRWTGGLHVDSTTKFSLSVLSPLQDRLVLSLQQPAWDAPRRLVPEMFNRPGALANKTSGPYGYDGASFTAVTYTFGAPAVGLWQLVVEVHGDVQQTAGVPDVMLIADNDSPYKLLSHLNSYELQLDQPVGISVQVYDAASFSDDMPISASSRPVALPAIDSAVLEVEFPNKHVAHIPMHDDGLHGDGLAADGVYGAVLTAVEAGSYRTRAMVQGTVNGVTIYRTSEHIVPVANPLFTLTGLGSATHDAATGIVSFFVDVDEPETMARVRAAAADQSDIDLTVRLYAEVWGSQVIAGDAEDYDEYEPVAWVQAMVDAEAHGSRTVMRLDLDERWLQKIGVVAPFQLRNVVMQDRSSNVLMSRREAIYIKDGTANLADVLRDRLDFGAKVEIDERMLMGPRPTKYARRDVAAAEAGKLVLVHGYCSGPVWSAADFTDAIVFEDFEQSRTQDAFALKLLDFMSSLPSCGIVGHSQGGLASLHLKAYYWSCLDTTTSPGRKIQSVGSPYYGCSIAGTLADLGSMFGTGCGQQTDLTVDGAQLWLSKVPMEPRNEVYYYTTQYKDAGFFSSDCVTGANLVLYAPNDGTCEKKFANLEGAHAMTHTIGQCHVTDMKYPPQCQDKSRNAEMSAAATR
jgi:hypothetical protein